MPSKPDGHYRTGQRQARLDFAGGPALAPHPARTEPQRRFVSELTRRESRGAAIVRRLRSGPATAVELLEVGGIRFHARVAELRAAGFVITATPGEGDLWTYRLLAEPPA